MTVLIVPRVKAIALTRSKGLNSPAISELGQRAARQAMAVGRRFGDDALSYCTERLDIGRMRATVAAVARLKGNVPSSFEAAQRRWDSCSPTCTFRNGPDWVEIWDADDFDPWEHLGWGTVRVIRYRQHKPDGTLCEAYWLTEYLRRQVGPQALYRMAKSRWEIQNQGFNDAKNRYGLLHICHYHPNSLPINWLIIALTLTLERFYRIRYLHRGNHPVIEPIALCRLLWLSTGIRNYANVCVIANTST